VAPDDRYRLAPVHDARTRAERVKRGELAVAVGDARSTETALALAISRVAVAREALRVALVGHSEITNLARRVLAERYIARCRRDLAAALGEEARAGSAHADKLGVIDEARSTLSRARAEREVIERHFARWREDRRKLADRRDDG
jgi:hypothetical protein